MGFPSDPKQREVQILARIQHGEYDVRWAEITSEHEGHRATFTVMADALQIEGVRIACSATLEQQIADVLGCSLLTAKLADIIYRQAACRLLPMPRPFTQSWDATVDQSRKIDEAIEAAGGCLDGCVSTVGKHWVLDNKLAVEPHRACNYGWHFTGETFQGQSWSVNASNLKDADGRLYRVIQGRGTAHDRGHSDYSQNCVLVQRTCYVDDVEMDLHDVLTSEELAPLASHQGVLQVLRQPGVDELLPR